MTGCGGNETARGPGATPCPVRLPAPTVVEPSAGAELTVSGDPGSPGGVFDPSVVYPAGAPAGVLAYSSVVARDAIRTRLAVSTDQGARWSYLAEANTPAPLTVGSTDTEACPSGACAGRLVNEVPSLILDAEEPDPAARWKLFTHRYLVLPGDRLRYDYGHIALFTAPAPEGPWSAGRNLIGWPSTSPLSSSGAALLTTEIPGLADCVALTEPGALARPGGIDLALGCAYQDGAPRIRIELLRSSDHARSFRRVRTLLAAAEADCLGVPGGRVNAPHLFVAAGRQYLSASPEREGAGYRGCAVLAIDDPESGAVRRDAAGALVVLRRLEPPTPRFSGACAYADGAAAMGYLLPVAFLDEPPRVFRILRSGIGAP